MGFGRCTAGRGLPWDQDNHPRSPELSEPLPSVAPDATRTAPAGATAATLDDRYGRTAGNRKRSRLIAIVAAAEGAMAAFAINAEFVAEATR